MNDWTLLMVFAGVSLGLGMLFGHWAGYRKAIDTMNLINTQAISQLLAKQRKDSDQ